MDDLIDIAIEYFGNDYILSATGKDIFYTCPFCEEKLGKIKTDRKLGVCIDPRSEHRLQWHCFRCGSSGKLEYKKSVSESLRKLGLNRVVQDERKVDQSEYNMVYLPKNPIQKGSLAHKYLLDRGIDDEKIEYYGLREGKDGYSRRVIIPNKFFGANWVDMFQARDYTGNMQPKYLNPAEIDKAKVVFNLHRQKKNCKQLIVCEGAITSICGGKNCVGVYGSHPSSSQLEQIISYNPKELICCLDNDEAGLTGLKQMLKDIKALQFKNTLSYVIMPKGKDAADLGEKVFQEYVKNNKRLYDEFSFNLVTKLL